MYMQPDTIAEIIDGVSEPLYIALWKVASQLSKDGYTPHLETAELQSLMKGNGVSKEIIKELGDIAKVYDAQLDKDLEEWNFPKEEDTESEGYVKCSLCPKTFPKGMQSSKYPTLCPRCRASTEYNDLYR